MDAINNQEPARVMSYRLAPAASEDACPPTLQHFLEQTAERYFLINLEGLRTPVVVDTRYAVRDAQPDRENQLGFGGSFPLAAIALQYSCQRIARFDKPRDLAAQQQTGIAAQHVAVLLVYFTNLGWRCAEHHQASDMDPFRIERGQ